MPSPSTSPRRYEAGADVIRLFDSSGRSALAGRTTRSSWQPYSARILAAVDVPDDSLRHRNGDAARGDARRGRRRDRARLADPAGLGLGGRSATIAACRATSRRSRALRAVGADRGRDPRRARPCGRPAGAHLQPRPRRACPIPIPTCSDGVARLCARADRTACPRERHCGRADGLRVAGPARGRAGLLRRHSRRPADHARATR